MSVRIRITNESAFTHGDALVKLFQGPKIVDGEHGLAKEVEARNLSVGESCAFSLEDGQYVSVEEPVPIDNVPRQLPLQTLLT